MPQGRFRPIFAQFRRFFAIFFEVIASNVPVVQLLVLQQVQDVSVVERFDGALNKSVSLS